MQIRDSHYENRLPGLRARIAASILAAALVHAFSNAPAAQTETRAGIIGLLTLSQLSGRLDCEPPPPLPREVPLYAGPRSSAIVGWVRAEKDPNPDDECYRAVLKVHRRADGSVRDLPTHEYEYERPWAAIVVEARGHWFKVRLDGGTAWINASPRDEYLALEDLLALNPAHLTQAWDGKLAATPGGASRRAPADPRRRPIGYVEPVLKWLRVVAAPGQDPEEVVRQYSSRHWGRNRV